MLLRLGLWVICFCLLAVACREATGPQPSPTRVPVANTPGATGAAPGEAPQAFADTEALQQGRFAFIYYLREIEGFREVPLSDAWAPQLVEEDEALRTYTFASDGWRLTLAQPLAEDAAFRYRAGLTGPDDFAYAADILPDGTVAPAQ